MTVDPYACSIQGVAAAEEGRAEPILSAFGLNHGQTEKGFAHSLSVCDKTA